jgi:hypothetical protein
LVVISSIVIFRKKRLQWINKFAKE